MRDAGSDVQRLKSALAAEIRRLLDVERLSVRAAQARTGIAAADFSRIRSNSDLKRFTIDRLMAIINRLGSRIEVSLQLQEPEPAEAAALNTSPSP
jgi:predicted XRE-type DNA-binding protein